VKGYCLLKSVASSEEVKLARDLLWQWLENQGTGIERSDPSTWTDEAWPKGYKRYGTLKDEGAVHMPVNWYLRSLPGVREAFSNIYNTDDLIASFDGMIVWRPWWDMEDPGDRLPNSSGLHIDQNPFAKPGFQCVQGMLPLYPVNESVGGTVLVPRSHYDEEQERLKKEHPSWGKEVNLKRDYCVIKPKYKLQEKAKLVLAEPGDLLLWDSRLVHAGSVGPGGGDVELARASFCVCLGPREKADRHVLERRKEALELGGHFSHWPWEASGNRGQISKDNPYIPPYLTQEQLALV